MIILEFQIIPPPPPFCEILGALCPHVIKILKENVDVKNLKIFLHTMRFLKEYPFVISKRFQVLYCRFCHQNTIFFLQNILNLFDIVVCKISMGGR